MRKLGGVCCTFLPNVYGDRNDEFSAGLPTDRFQLEWWIMSDWVEKHHRDPQTLAAEAAQIRSTARRFNRASVKNGLLYPDRLSDNWAG